ncbi:hypothetical protein imdm_298 [gamma proteobacterium IMCC2047]|nr:hypothetical protein imdm_298 [gamma proteobacterium IMCC2047]
MLLPQILSLFINHSIAANDTVNCPPCPLKQGDKRRLI